ncbi:hypothetical protein SUGI_0892620 [Cryptomeria japonica]|nr:hypothetical protein SUGI_0892620 [Cryptomeria japonica]
MDVLNKRGYGVGKGFGNRRSRPFCAKKNLGGQLPGLGVLEASVLYKFAPAPTALFSIPQAMILVRYFRTLLACNNNVDAHHHNQHCQQHLYRHSRM